MTKPHTTLSEVVRALETIKRNDFEVFDGDLGETVLVSMSAEEMQQARPLRHLNPNKILNRKPRTELRGILKVLQ